MASDKKVREYSVSILILLTAAAFWGQDSGARSPDQNPSDLVRRAVHNELTAATAPTSHFLFRGVKTTPKGSTTRIYVEAKDATAGLVVAYNGKILTPDQQRDERARLDRFVRNPEELEKKRQQERENAERSLRITRALPDAFLYEYATDEAAPVGVGHPGESLVRLNFRPKPLYDPPTRVEEILTGMRGYILIDASHGRLAKIDGTLFKEVGFGWGILGHLDRGGHFLVQQQELGDGLWQISSLSLKFTGRIFLVKSLDINSTETFSDFKQVPPNLTFAEALELLKKEESQMTKGSLPAGHPQVAQQE